jgi:potassium inwardly-rectifying channel subfamily J
LTLENNGRVFLILPQTVCHIIDETSPFYDMSARDLLQRRFEIVVSLTGISRHTSETYQARTSYLTKEILWGHRFTNAIAYDREEGTYVTIVEKLDEVNRIDTVLCSAHRLNEILADAREAIEYSKINFYNNQIQEFPEEEEDDDEFESDDAGLEMMKTPQLEVTLQEPPQQNTRKFNVTKVDEKI